MNEEWINVDHVKRIFEALWFEEMKKR